MVRFGPFSSRSEPGLAGLGTESSVTIWDLGLSPGFEIGTGWDLGLSPSQGGRTGHSVHSLSVGLQSPVRDCVWLGAAALRWWSFCSIFLHCLHSVPFGASKLTHRRVIFEQICLGCACQSYYYLNFSFGMDGGHFRMCFCCLFVLSSLIWTRSTTDGAM